MLCGFMGNLFSSHVPMTITAYDTEGLRDNILLSSFFCLLLPVCSEPCCSLPFTLSVIQCKSFRCRRQLSWARIIASCSIIMLYNRKIEKVVYQTEADIDQINKRQLTDCLTCIAISRLYLSAGKSCILVQTSNKM